jgi:ribose transport system substrate-binding protein
MRHLKITVFVFGVLALLLAAAGCGSGNVTTSTASTTTVDGKRLKIGVSIPAADHGWTAGVVWWAKQTMEMYPDVEWTFATAENPDKQIKDLETMMVKGVDAIVVLATESAPITPTAEEINKRGILLVNVDRGFLKPVADVFIEGDNKAFGRKSAEFMVERLGGQGKVLVLTGIPCTVDTDRVEAAMEVFKRSPGVQVLDRQAGMWNRQKSYEVTQTLLLKHKEVDAIWAQDDDMALGVEQALKEAGRDKNIWILGGAGMKDIVKRVMDRDPLYPANITYPPSMISVGVHQAVSILRDGQKDKILQFMPRHMMIDVELILPDNAQRFYFPDSVF